MYFPRLGAVEVESKEVVRGFKFTLKILFQFLLQLCQGEFFSCDESVVDILDHEAGRAFVQVAKQAGVIGALGKPYVG